MAQFAVVLGRIAGQNIPYLNSIAEWLSGRRGGTNFGDWFSVVKEASDSRAFRSIEAGTPLSELRTLM